jgi:hypothetical protein
MRPSKNSKPASKKKTKLPAVVIAAQKAMRSAVREAMEERIRLGISASVWKDGKVVTIPAKKINLKNLGL